MSHTVSITCPHCAAAIRVDVEAGVVVESHVPVAAKEKVDFEARLKQIESDKVRASERMAEAMRREQSKDRIMEDRFRQLLDEAKTKGDQGRPMRDIDLD
jgi:copper chaperone CopZ